MQEFSDSRDFIVLNCVAPSEDQVGYDSDTLVSPTINGNIESSSCNRSYGEIASGRECCHFSYKCCSVLSPNVFVN
jgi:hypothetical protein